MKIFCICLSILFMTFAITLLILPVTVFADTATVSFEKTNFPNSVDETNFPDEIWREHVNTYYAGGDYLLTQTEAEAVKDIFVAGLGIKDLTGIEYFTNAVNLSCRDNYLTSLNVKMLKYLQFIDCSYNSLTSLGVVGMGSLDAIYCAGNILTSLDLTGCGSLQTLICFENLLISLDLTGCESLVFIDCSDNSLSFLDVTELGSLQSIRCSDNSLLDIIGMQNWNTAFGRGQQRTVSIIADPEGGMMSESTYSFAPGHTIDFHDSGVTFGADNRFHMDSLITTSPFTSDLMHPESLLEGELAFALVKHTVSFVDWDETVLATVIIADGDAATAPTEPKREGWKFTGWDTSFTKVTEDLVVKAFYEEIIVPESIPEPIPEPIAGSTPEPTPAPDVSVTKHLNGRPSTGDNLSSALGFGILLVASGIVIAAIRKKVKH